MDADRLAGFRVAEVLTAKPHPDADKLQVLTVNTGPEINGGEPLQVVCGAPNARAGMKGVLGLPGAVVPANGMELRKSAIRGVESNGMMCSTRELELGDDHDGIIELPADAPVGTAFSVNPAVPPAGTLMVCVPVPVVPFTVALAVRAWGPGVVPVRVLDAVPARVCGATGAKLPPGRDKATAVPSLAAVPLTVTCACTAMGACSPAWLARREVLRLFCRSGREVTISLTA